MFLVSLAVLANLVLAILKTIGIIDISWYIIYWWYVGMGLIAFGAEDG